MSESVLTDVLSAIGEYGLQSHYELCDYGFDQTQTWDLIEEASQSGYCSPPDTGFGIRLSKAGKEKLKELEATR